MFMHSATPELHSACQLRKWAYVIESQHCISIDHKSVGKFGKVLEWVQKRT